MSHMLFFASKLNDFNPASIVNNVEDRIGVTHWIES